METKTKSKNNCKKGYSCGLTCINVKLKCRKDGLKGQFVTLTEEYFKKAMPDTNKLLGINFVKTYPMGYKPPEVSEKARLSLQGFINSTDKKDYSEYNLAVRPDGGLFVINTKNNIALGLNSLGDIDKDSKGNIKKYQSVLSTQKEFRVDLPKSKTSKFKLDGDALEIEDGEYRYNNMSSQTTVLVEDGKVKYKESGNPYKLSTDKTKNTLMRKSWLLRDLQKGRLKKV